MTTYFFQPMVIEINSQKLRRKNISNQKTI